ncbi:uncharacterized protein Rexo5 isoform X3 [Hetaerina americana]|uniref:uncharacterized protein Rexo5 isoform X3 n=1 Tax=Hetaerina americana TaxID=62018 RepID=UPI003A7F2CF7
MSEEMKRKLHRIEKKKKKIAAFLEMAKLNEDDRKAKVKKSKEDKTDSAEFEQDIHAPKRAKTEDCLVDNDNGANHLHEEVNPDVSHESPDQNFANADIDDLRKMLRERKKRLLIPKFRLKESGEMASLYMTEDHRIPLFMVDVQHLIMWSLLGHHAPFAPSRWYQLLKFNKLSHTVVLAVDGISVNDLQSAAGFLRLPSQPRDDECEALSSPSEKLFPWKLEFVGPLSYGSNLVQEIATVPLSNTQYDRVIKKEIGCGGIMYVSYGSIEKALKGNAIYKVFRTMFPVQFAEKNEHSNDLEKDDCFKKGQAKDNLKMKDAFPRTELLLSVDQMVEMGYPLPLLKNPDGTKQPLVFHNEFHEKEAKIAGSIGTLIHSSEFRKNSNKSEVQEGFASCDLAHQEKEKDDAEEEADEETYVFSRPLYKEVGPNSPMFGVDCEMCQTGERRSELTRISIVNEDLEVVYESLVKPHRKITNYLTRFSGITEKMLKNVKTRLKDVQEHIRNLLPADAILVGQSLNFDLHAMKMMHPYVIDTSIVYNLSGDRCRRTKLATLSRLFLSENIQCAGAKGHDSVEDASAAMKLVLLKLSKSMHFGDAVVSDLVARQASKKSKQSSRQKRLAQDLEMGANGVAAYATSVFTHVNRGKHAAAIVGMEDTISEYESYVDIRNSEKDYVDFSHSEGKPPNLLRLQHPSEVITSACENMLEHQLCIVHLAKDSVGKKLRTLRRWCTKIVEHAAPCSLCILILGGTDNLNGACFIHLKGPSDEII